MQRVFRNENPFETSKFGPFLPQLPPVSNMSTILRHGLCALAAVSAIDHLPAPAAEAGRGFRAMECDTCAVAGGSDSLLLASDCVLMSPK